MIEEKRITGVYLTVLGYGMGNYKDSKLAFIKRRKGKCKVFHSPIDVRLPKNRKTADDEIFTVVQPDIVVVCDPSKIDEKGVIGAPCTTYDIVYTPDAKIPVHTVKGLKISLKELFED